MNTNCLEGFQRPTCKSYGPFRITATAVFHVHNDGISDHGYVEWEDDSYCQCFECDFSAKVKDFKRVGQ